MHIEQAVPLGMIIHELATNSIKYAWQGTQNKKIDIHIENNNGALMLSYNDNGKGLPTNLDIKATTSLGLKLVDLFIHRQLQGSMIYENRNGAFFKFTFTLR
jgi:two-component sensor histidine kinase